ncbi:GNAT family N-acetyltransferase [Micromonospora halophytica]|uniref:Acetyltransferase (GNAT) family protein n=1 Tax=Micromonospora halophytica TaxID=47864 RepID=A0A1C5JD63_9ACTN|nr:GNAT family N-acetyltransferase [Micromonospora halophytica]SCG68482.1 Acetyltransferase (GNAT) family protein [Micromonospora halophytica]
MTVRPAGPAGPADLPALVAPRIANAEAHLALDPTAYRVPDPAVVAGHFRDTLAADRDAILVAEAADGQVVGMVEVLRQADPPAHQILRPEASAAVHTVVLPGHRGRGVGAALLAAAREWASAVGCHRRPDPGPLYGG